MAYKKRSYWTEEEVKFLKSNYPKLTFFEIAKEIGRTPQLVRNKAVSIGLYDTGTKRPKKQVSKVIVNNHVPSSYNRLKANYNL